MKKGTIVLVQSRIQPVAMLMAYQGPCYRQDENGWGYEGDRFHALTPPSTKDYFVPTGTATYQEIGHGSPKA